VGALAVALTLAGCGAPTVAPEDEPVTMTRSLLKRVQFATTAEPPADFVRAARRDPASLSYIPLGTPQDEPTLKPTDQAGVERRTKAAQAMKPRRDAIAAGAPKPRPAPQLPASALEAKKEHDERMRERATEAE
jgi:hypothetical protein